MKKKKKDKESMEIGKGLKKKIMGHIKQDSKEFKGQLKDDVKLKKMLRKAPKED